MADETTGSSAAEKPCLLDDQKLGELLVEQGLLNKAELRRIVAAQIEDGGSLGQAMAKQGAVDEERIKSIIDELAIAHGVIERLIRELDRMQVRTSAPPVSPDGKPKPELRRFPRYDVSIDCKFLRHNVDRKALGSEADIVHRSIAIDISQGGLRMIVDLSLEVGEKLTIFIYAKEDSCRKVVAEVMRVMKRQNQFDVGVSFLRA